MNLSTLQNKSWFDSITEDQFGRIVVYVNQMSEDIFKQVPETLDNKNVLIHFAGYKNATREQFTNATLSIKDRLLLLQNFCDNSLPILQDIFFEEHDQNNAVSNLSSQFPIVREEMSKLFEEFGFDILFEELKIEN
jgi:hypothetical protein